MIRQDIKTNFIDFLVAQKKIDPNAREIFLGFDSFTELEDRLKKSNVLKPEELARSKAEFFKLPYVDLEEKRLIQMC